MYSYRAHNKPLTPSLNTQTVTQVFPPHQLHTDGGGHSPRLLESPGEVEQSGSQRRLQHDEHRAERAEPRRVRMRRGPGQKADALPGQFLHDPEPAPRLTAPGGEYYTFPERFPAQLTFPKWSRCLVHPPEFLNLLSGEPRRYIAHTHAHRRLTWSNWTFLRIKHFTLR